MEPRLPLVVIVGPTASGKTSLAVKLARTYGGEIICADSRTIYKGMSIGTAKPNQSEQAGVPHWGLDLVEPGMHFTAADFKAYAVQKIAEIRARGRIPFLVGGTGLYVDAVVFDYQFGGESNPERRLQLEAMTIEDLHKYCTKNNIMLPENTQNKRYVIRAIETNGFKKQRQDAPLSTSIIVGIATERDTLRTQINERAEQLFDDGVVEEAIMLGRKYGWESEAMTGNIYPLVRRYLDGGLAMDDVKDIFKTLDWRLAKRQMTWLRRNPYIEWKSLIEAEQYLSDKLASAQKS